MRAQSPIESQILHLIEPAAQALAMRIVRVRIQGAKYVRLQIMAERMADGQMVIEDCVNLSRAISAVLDVEDPIASEYNLEVSSPGIDRPLVILSDFERWIGYEAKIETKNLHDGRRRFSGILRAVEGQAVHIEAADNIVYVIDFDAIGEARLILTDRLITEDLRRSDAQLRGGDIVIGEDADDAQDMAPARPAPKPKTSPKTRNTPNPADKATSSKPSMKSKTNKGKPA